MDSGVRLCVLSDTHGRLPREAVEFCEDASAILHAGDVGSDAILPELESVAPVVCVSGNVDAPGLAPDRARTEAAGWRILLQHIVWRKGGPSGEVRELLEREGADIVVFGHTHKALCRKVGETVFFNPGSCGPKRFDSPRTLGEAVLDGAGGWFRVFDLDRMRGAPPLVESRFGPPAPSDEG